VSTIPSPFQRLVDDAALFPPASLPLATAVAEHRGHRGSGYADLVGPFVVADVAIPDLLAVLRAEPAGGPLPVSVVVTGGAGAIEPAVVWAARAEELTLAALELPLRGEDDLAYNARRVTTVVDQLRATGSLGEETPVHVEPPRPPGAPTPSWLDALDELAALELRLKFRTGGTSADAFPTPDELAACIGAALDRELPFKCTAGLHRAVRHHDPGTGYEHHGFLNVLLATRASLDGAAVDEVARLLDEQSVPAVTTALGEHGPDSLASTRRWFTSVGSCSVTEPLEDLRTLGLLPRRSGEDA
jgi:hypothetical protein